MAVTHIPLSLSLSLSFISVQFDPFLLILLLHLNNDQVNFKVLNGTGQNAFTTACGGGHKGDGPHFFILAKTKINNPNDSGNQFAFLHFKRQKAPFDFDIYYLYFILLHKHTSPFHLIFSSPHLSSSSSPSYGS